MRSFKCINNDVNKRSSIKYYSYIPVYLLRLRDLSVVFNTLVMCHQFNYFYHTLNKNVVIFISLIFIIYMMFNDYFTTLINDRLN